MTAASGRFPPETSLRCFGLERAAGRASRLVSCAAGGGARIRSYDPHMQVIASAEARDFVRTNGGQLFVWLQKGG